MKLGDFIKFYGKIPDIFILITGHFGLFKPPTLRLGEAGTTQIQSQTRRLRIAKINFKSVRKTITLRLREAGKTQAQSQTWRLNISKTDFKSVRKTITLRLREAGKTQAQSQT